MAPAHKLVKPSPLKSPRITTRSLLIGILYVLFLCSLTPYNDYYIRNTFVSGNHFPIGSFFLFTLLVLGLNPLLSRIRRESVLTPTELLTIWIMMIVASGIPSSGYLRYHLFMLTAPFYYASSENDWANLFWSYLPDWLVVKDPKAVRTFYEGIEPGDSIPWGEWVRPAFVWTLYLLTTLFVLYNIATLLRRQWVERERFAFPLVQLPVEMVAPPEAGYSLNAFLRNRTLWIGFALPVGLHMLNGLHAHFPAVPQIPLSFYPDRYLTERPWSAMRSIILMVYPSVIGFSYLLSLDVSLSFWLFYLLYKAQSVAVAAFGLSTDGWTLANRQEMGAYLTLVFFVLWLARRHVKEVFDVAVGRRHVDDSNEPLPFSVAFWGVVLGTLALSFMAKLAGMSFWLALGVHGFFYVMCIVLTWMVTDGGFLFLLAIFRPSDYILIPLGTSRVSPRSLTILAYEKTLMFDLREFAMPHFMNSFKAADAVALNRRRLLLPISLSLLVAIPAAYGSGLWLWYTKGGVNLGYWWPPEPFDRLARQLAYPTGTNETELFYIGVGSVVMGFLIFLRYRFLWWRVHPLGYAMTTSWAPYTVWFSFFLGWLFKFVILKSGGFRGFRRCRPFFLGMVIGEALMAGFWILVGLWTQVPYRIMPG